GPAVSRKASGESERVRRRRGGAHQNGVETHTAGASEYGRLEVLILAVERLRAGALGELYGDRVGIDPIGGGAGRGKHTHDELSNDPEPNDADVLPERS